MHFTLDTMFQKSILHFLRTFHSLKEKDFNPPHAVSSSRTAYAFTTYCRPHIQENVESSNERIRHGRLAGYSLENAGGSSHFMNYPVSPTQDKELYVIIMISSLTREYIVFGTS